MRLGQLGIQEAERLVKEAAQAPPPGDGSYRTVATGGDAQTVVGALSSVLTAVGGEDIGALAAAGMTMLGPLLQSFGVNLQAPVQTQYGHSWQQAMQDSQVAAGLAQQASGEQLRAVGNILSHISEQLAQRGAPEKAVNSVRDLASLIQSNEARAIAGPMVQVLATSIPQIGQAIQQAEPGMITDYSPLVHAHRRENNGEIDERRLHETVEAFREFYARGQYPDGVPAQTAAFSVAFAADRGARGLRMFEASRNIAQVADTMLEGGLAETFGHAMLLAQSVDRNFVNDPTKTMQAVNSLNAYVRSKAIDPRMVAGAMQQAAQQGVNPWVAAHSFAQSQEAGAQLGQGTQTRYLDTVNKLMGSHRMNTLGKLYAMSPEIGDRIDAAVAAGDIGTLNNLYRRYANNTQLRRMDPGLATDFIDRLAQSPNMMNRMLRSEIQGAAGDYSLTDQDVDLARQGKLRQSPVLRRLAQRGGRHAVDSALAMHVGGEMPSASPELRKTLVRRFGLQTPKPAAPESPTAVTPAVTDPVGA